VNGVSNLFGKQDDLRYSAKERKIFAASKAIGWTVVGCGLGGIIFIAMWANGVISHPPEGSPAVGISAFLGADLLVAAAAAAAGGVFGFVFGIPRTLDPASRAAVATAATLAGPAAASQAVMAANTNLERISDWLTTLLIGATLVQIKEITGWVGSLGKNLIGTGPAANDAVVPIIVIYFFAVSFLGVYLITRLYLTSAFEQTLGILTGGAESAPDLGELKQKLDAAIESGKAEDLTAAMTAYDAINLSNTQREDADLCGKVARILAKMMAGGTATGRAGDPAVELKNAVAKAAAVPAIKEQLKREIASGQIITGNNTLDAEINSLLA
jgi:hypothetical protein